MTFQLITTDAEFQLLAAEWDTLHERSSVAESPFMTWDWASLWWKHSQQRCELRVGIVRDAAGALQGIAPFVLGAGTGGMRRWLKHLSFLGGLEPIVSEGMDLIIPAGGEAEIAPLLLQVIRQTAWDVLDLPFHYEGTATLAAFRAATAGLGQLVDRFAPVPSHRQKLYAPPANMEDVLSRGDASQHRNRWKKLQREHQGRVLVAPDELPMEQAFEAMLLLHAQRYAEGESTFLLPSVLAFHRELMQRWAAKGKAIVICMEADGKIIATRYCLLHHGVAFDFQGGFDQKYNYFSVGRIITVRAMAEAVHRGCTIYDHLPGDQQHKRRVTDHKLVFHHRELFHPERPLPTAFNVLRELKRKLNPSAAEGLAALDPA
jgi:CelD/BcsL family acetyltransferase involved in cellulose biosynthesis